jgi:adenylosuccinate lyase
LSFEPISPIDGRYAEEARPLSPYFSEEALFRARFKVELAYLSLLVRVGVAPNRKVPAVPFSMREIGSLEKKTGHDVKAVEVYIRQRLEKIEPALAPFVHLGLTSEDTTSLAFAKLLAGASDSVLVPAYSELALALSDLAGREAGTAMLARTHGRPAVPTTFGKELAVFAYRVAERVSLLASTKPMAKFSGAVGTYASFTSMGSKDWRAVLRGFVESMGVDCAPYSTQVVPGERLSDILHSVVSLNQVMVGLARDLWFYQALGYVRFERPGKVSSSTMPQKVNPVDLENAEGQAEVSNAILGMLAYRMQLSRLQRDLSDSVMRRMVGQGLAHSYVACGRILRSLESLKVERGAMRADLDAHPEVFAEAAQVRLRLEGDAGGYEKVRRELENGRFSPKGVPAIGGYLGLSVRLAKGCRRDVLKLLRTRT